MLRLFLMMVLSGALVAGAAMLALSGTSGSPGNPETRALLRRLADSDPDVRREAEARLRAMRDQALPALREACEARDPELARRARRLVDDMEGRAEVLSIPSETTGVPLPEAVSPPVELELQIPVADVEAGAPIRFYVRLRNNGAQPLLVARHFLGMLPTYGAFARFEIALEDGEVFQIAPEPWPTPNAPPDVVVVPAGVPMDLYFGSSQIPTALYERLTRAGRHRIRFVYDATDSYRAAVAGLLHEGAALPAEKIASNWAEISVR
ncbi:MAG: hypothetical protein HYY16_10970 [Planctomycetes bacterium]|nr:hypothetical protein [Planctomycetota bacterium]